MSTSMEPSSISEDKANDALIEKQAALLFSSAFTYTPKARNLESLKFDESKAIELCISKFFRVLDQHFDLHSFGAPTKFIIKEQLTHALYEAEKKTFDLVTTILERHIDISNDKWNDMHQAVIQLCKKMKLVVESKNGRNLNLFVDRVQGKIQTEFKLTLKDQLYFLFVDDPNTIATPYFGKHGKEIYLRKFYYHNEVIRIVRELAYMAFVKCDQFAIKLNPSGKPEMESDKTLKKIEHEMWAQGEKVVKQNKRNILAFREFISNNRAELDSFLEKNSEKLTMPETQKEIKAFLETSTAQIKHVCNTFAVNNCGRLGNLYVKNLKDAVELAVKNAKEAEKVRASSSANANRSAIYQRQSQGKYNGYLWKIFFKSKLLLLK